MNRPSTAAIEALMEETGMAFVQARNHLIQQAALLRDRNRRLPR